MTDVKYVIEPIAADDSLPRRTREKEAVDRILRKHLPDAELVHDTYGAPAAADGSVSLSISHSMGYAAVAWTAEAVAIGIDIEEPREGQLARVADKFLTPSEKTYYSGLPNGLLKAWTLKEAAFKAMRRGPADLREYKLPLTADDCCIRVGDKKLTIIKSGPEADGLYISLVSE